MNALSFFLATTLCAVGSSLVADTTPHAFGLSLMCIGIITALDGTRRL
jgi:hypothetical protein